MGLEEAQLADALCADTAGGEVGHAAGLKLKADVGDVNLAGEDGQADGVEVAHGGLSEAENDIQVVDHEIEDYIDVERAWGKDAEAVRLKKHRTVQPGLDGSHGGVETLKMSDGENAIMLLRESKEVVRLPGSCGDGLLNQKIDARGEQGQSHGMIR